MLRDKRKGEDQNENCISEEKEINVVSCNGRVSFKGGRGGGHLAIIYVP